MARSEASALGLLIALALVVGCVPGSSIDAPSSGATDTPIAHDSFDAGISEGAQLAGGLPGGPEGKRRLPSVPFAARSAGGDALFTQLTPAETGVDFNSPIDLSHPLKRLYVSGFATGGVAIGDIDGDDLPDLFLASGPRSNRLFKQRGRLEFSDVTEDAGLTADDVWSAGAAFGDVDNDGDLDLFVCNYVEPCLLYINDGSGKFSENAKRAGVDLRDACLMPSFCDYDSDGDLDLFILTNRLYRPGGRPRTPPFSVAGGVPVVLPEYERYYGLSRRADGGYDMDTLGRPNYMLRNNGDGTFSDVSEEIGLVGMGHGLSATWWDYNGDRRPDLYVANDFDDPDQLYQNNGDGTFTDVLEKAAPHTSWFSMGSDAADLNGDCRYDLLVADMSARSHFDQKTTMGAMNEAKLAKVSGPPPQIMKNALLLGSGADRMFEAAELAGLADTDWTWAIKLADFDNDALVDVVATNGISRSYNDSDIPFNTSMLIGRTEWSLYEATAPRKERNLAVANRGDLRFEDVSDAWGFNHYGMSYGAAYGDLDRDGDLDLVVVNLDEPVHIYRNDSDGGNRVLISLRGESSNRFGIGAHLTLQTADGVRQVRMLSPYTGFLSSNDPVVHFGLGQATAIEQLTIDWPSGTRQVIRDLAPNMWHTAYEADSGGTKTDPDLQPRPLPLFADVKQFPPLGHREQTYNDFERQPLLPNKLSQLGPGLAVADFSGDGLDDVFMGGAKGQAGALIVANANGSFRVKACKALNEDRGCEDMGAVWFDADSDGDLDLYVVSGGVECEPGDEVLRDRLYLNSGAGEFVRAVDALPDLTDSGSVVCAADFDRDGDLDLFVGSRVVPGEYPVSPASRLLRNDGGRFADATEELAPALLTAGLVTSGVWSDVDNDGWVDLLLTTEWGPVRFLRNQEGRLTDATSHTGLADQKGWYNGIAARDLDGDGDIDYVVTNFGLNTKYHASRDKPVLLYYGDFEGKGERQLIEAEFESDKLFPIRGKSCSTRAIPTLGDKFTSYRKFAAATLEDIYTPTCLEAADRYECNTLESGILRNDGSGRFEFEALPRLAQVAPSFGVIATEVNGDGRPDLYLAQNFFTAQPETGRMDGGMGLLLMGSAAGKFDVVTPDRSGLVVDGDAKAAVVAHGGRGTNPTLLVSVNDAPPRVFRMPPATEADDQTGQAPRTVSVALAGALGNASGYGSRVEVTGADGTTQTAEVAAGGGYLSQSSAKLTFAAAPGAEWTSIEVRWPDGSRSSHVPTQEAVQTLIKPLD